MNVFDFQNLLLLHKPITPRYSRFTRLFPIVTCLSLLLGGCASDENRSSYDKTQGSHIYRAANAPRLGNYDDSLIKAIERTWYSFIDSHKGDKFPRGKVVLEFHLTVDGHITDLNVVKSNVPDMQTYLCKTAVLNSAPFPAWSNDMRRMVGKDYREVRFTFYYE